MGYESACGISSRVVVVSGLRIAGHSYSVLAPGTPFPSSSSLLLLSFTHVLSNDNQWHPLATASPLPPPSLAHSVLPLLAPLRTAPLTPLLHSSPAPPAVQCSQRHDCISCANTPDCGWCPTTRNTKQTKASKGKCQKGPSGCGGGYITPAAENDDSALDKCGSIEEFGASSLRRR